MKRRIKHYIYKGKKHRRLIIPVIFGIAFAVFLAAWYTDIKAVRNGDVISVHTQVIIPTITPVITPEIPVRKPVKLQVEKLGISNILESVGIDAKGKMDIPKNADNAGWFELGYKPGEKGNAVIAGHLDKVTGAPAIFYTLSKLSFGDVIKITDEDGKILSFSVKEKVSYPYDNFPLEKVFGKSDTQNLNLITCNGTWDRLKRTYDQRLVVYSTLITE